MTRTDWDALMHEDPRACDVIVAEKVMDAKWWRSSVTGNRCLYVGKPPGWFDVLADGTERIVGDFAHVPFRPYTTSWDAMREVVEKMEADGHRWAWDNEAYEARPHKPRWYCTSFWDGPNCANAHATAPTLPEAVCIAALTALGHMEDRR